MNFQTTHAFARTDRSRLGVWWWTTDRWLLGATAILVTLGVLLSFASSPAAAQRIGAKRTFFTHLTHENPHAALAERLPAGIAPAYDGLVIEVDAA